MAEREKKELWQEFRGKVNTDQILAEKAEALAVFLAGSLPEFTKSLFSLLRKSQLNPDEDKYGWDVFFEAVFLFLHWVDREALTHLGTERRVIFINAFVLELRELLSHFYETGVAASKFRDTFDAMLQVRQIEYGRFDQLITAKFGGVFGEFSQKVARIVGDGELDMKAVVVVHTYVVCSLLEHDLPGLLIG